MKKFFLALPALLALVMTACTDVRIDTGLDWGTESYSNYDNAKAIDEIYDRIFSSHYTVTGNHSALMRALPSRDAKDNEIIGYAKQAEAEALALNLNWGAGQRVIYRVKRETESKKISENVSEAQYETIYRYIFGDQTTYTEADLDHFELTYTAYLDGALASKVETLTLKYTDIATGKDAALDATVFSKEHPVVATSKGTNRDFNFTMGITLKAGVDSAAICSSTDKCELYMDYVAAVVYKNGKSQTLAGSTRPLTYGGKTVYKLSTQGYLTRKNSLVWNDNTGLFDVK